MDKKEKSILNQLSSEAAKPSEKFKNELAQKLDLNIKNGKEFKISIFQLASTFAVFTVIVTTGLMQFDAPLSNNETAINMPDEMTANAPGNPSTEDGLLSEGANISALSDGPRISQSQEAQDTSQDFSSPTYIFEQLNIQMQVEESWSIVVISERENIKLRIGTDLGVIYVQNNKPKNLGSQADEFLGYKVFETDNSTNFINNKTSIFIVAEGDNLTDISTVARNLIATFSLSQ